MTGTKPAQRCYLLTYDLSSREPMRPDSLSQAALALASAGIWALRYGSSVTDAPTRARRLARSHLGIRLRDGR
ncbi:MAG: hypothetical protein M3256_23825 [Actinomycetota bacterium]|nr:hypothetical protein [Actinomycetota bacterium]